MVMHKQAVIYIAVADADVPVADIILAHLAQTGYRCIDCTDVPTLLNAKTDLYGTMSDSDVIVLIDSASFRQQVPNHELQFAQVLEKPLVVISLHQAVDESCSNARVRLFDFTRPTHNDWQRVIDAIVEVTESVTSHTGFSFLPNS